MQALQSFFHSKLIPARGFYHSVVMPGLLNVMQVFLFSVLFCQYTIAFPAFNSDVTYDDSLVRMGSRSCRRCWFPRDSADADGPAVEDRGHGRLELQTRQLGDLEFASRYAELLKSKAKLSSLCSFLRRMQNSKKSGPPGDTERVNTLLKQYMCANVYQ